MEILSSLYHEWNFSCNRHVIFNLRRNPGNMFNYIVRRELRLTIEEQVTITQLLLHSFTTYRGYIGCGSIQVFRRLSLPIAIDFACWKSISSLLDYPDTTRAKLFVPCKRLWLPEEARQGRFPLEEVGNGASAEGRRQDRCPTTVQWCPQLYFLRIQLWPILARNETGHGKTPWLENFPIFHRKFISHLEIIPTVRSGSRIRSIRDILPISSYKLETYISYVSFSVNKNKWKFEKVNRSVKLERSFVFFCYA